MIVRWMSEKEAAWAGNAPLVAGGAVARINGRGRHPYDYDLLAVGTYPNGQPIGDGPAVEPRKAAKLLAEELMASVAIWSNGHTEDLDSPEERNAALRALELLDPEAATKIRSFREQPTPEGADEARRWLTKRFEDVQTGR